jgi:hypothetical protein
MRRKDKQLLAFVKKKKKPPPFQGKVLGGTARSRPDRKAYGGKVAAKADAEPISPNEPNAPAGGRVAQKFQVGGMPRPIIPARADLGMTWGRRGPLGPPSREKGGAVKRQEGGAIPPNLPRSRAAVRKPQEVEFDFRPKGKAQEVEFDPFKLKGREPVEVGPPQRKHGGIARRQDGGDVKDQEASNDEEDEGVSEYKRGGVLSAKQRQSLPSSSFALPGKGKGPKGAGAGSYPIPDESHARNALARVSQHGSPAEKATVRAKVKRKYPGIQVGG